MKSLLVTATILLAASACGSGPSAEPADAVETYFRALEAGDCGGARQVVLRPGELDCTIVGDLEGALAADGIDLADVSFSTEDVVADSATVEIRWGSGDPEIIEVERQDGAWLVVVDSAV